MNNPMKYLSRRSRSKPGDILCWGFAVLLVGGVILTGSAKAQAQHRVFRSTAGYLLVATPQLDHSNFGRTVILMLEHDADGAMGLVVNRRIGRTRAADLLSTMGLAPAGQRGEVDIYSGGPVEQERGFVLHSPDYKGPGTTVINHSLAVTTRSEVIRELANGRGPKQSMVIFGYAGWGPGQLDDEIAAGAWFTIPLDTTLVFDKDPDRKWEKAMDRRGIEL